MANPHTHPGNDPLDALLRRMPVQAGSDFAARTLARLHEDEARADARLDALLGAHAVAAPTDFAANTLSRLRDADAEERIDELLEEQPVVAADDFTERTVARAHGRRRLADIFNLPAAAAAAFVLSVGALWMQGPAGMAPQMAEVPGQDAAATSEVATSAAAPEQVQAELLTLADGLKGAAPLLDARTPDALAVLTSWGK